MKQGTVSITGSAMSEYHYLKKICFIAPKDCQLTHYNDQIPQNAINLQFWAAINLIMHIISQCTNELGSHIKDLRSEISAMDNDSVVRLF